MELRTCSKVSSLRLQIRKSRPVKTTFSRQITCVRSLVPTSSLQSLSPSAKAPSIVAFGPQSMVSTSSPEEPRSFRQLQAQRSVIQEAREALLMN